MREKAIEFIKETAGFELVTIEDAILAVDIALGYTPLKPEENVEEEND